MTNQSKFIALILTMTMNALSGQDTDHKLIAYTEAKVWNGKSFEQRDLFVQKSLFVEANRSEADSIISLSGDYIVPPYGDAHTHNFGAGGYSIKIAEEDYLPAGVFYAMDLTNPYSEIKQVKDHFEKINTVDVMYTNGGITSTGSHPTGAMERIFTDKEKITLDNLELEGDAYWFIDNLEDLDKKWSKIMAQEPDVLKIYMTHVQKGLDKGECYGLCPEVTKAVVDKANQAGIRVLAHINTKKDVQYALNAGVDGIAHIPSGNDNIKVNQKDFWLDQQLIDKLGKARLIITPTASLLIEDADPEDLIEEIRKQKEQINALHESGARLALGADEWRKTSIYEVMYFHKYNFFDNATLLNIFTKETSQAIFPNRKIGEINKGYEASFLVLKDNPIKDFEAIKKIKLGVKQGVKVIEKSN